MGHSAVMTSLPSGLWRLPLTRPAHPLAAPADAHRLQASRRWGVARLILLAALLAGAAGPLWASDDDDDHERARAALQAGQVLPLKQVLERLAQTHPGEVLEVELEQDHGRWRYEIKLLQAGGQLRKLKVDARTGEPLQRPPRHGGPASSPAPLRPVPAATAQGASR